jgi:hypothetical protein
MTNRIRITAGQVSLTASLKENETARAIYKALPIEGQANRWGDEIYFTITVQLPESEDAREEMDVGDLAYWPTGKAFCIFFGPTPVSRGSQPRAYSNVNPFGKVEGDSAEFRKVKDGEKIEITAV